MRRLVSLGFALAWLAACGDNEFTVPDAAPADGAPVDAVCAGDPRYGNGSCQLDLACGVPDIDCFVLFPTDLDAGSWAQIRIGTSPLDVSQPTYLRGRALLDRAWAMFQDEVAVGGLADHRVGLAVMDDMSINAYVLPDGAPGKVGMSVQVNRGLLESSLNDEQVIGVLLHELTHVVRLHALTDVAYLTRRFYVAHDGEPRGAVEPEHAKARAAGNAWRTQAVVTGIVSDPLYGDLPIDGNLGNLFGQYTGSVQTRLPACNATVNRMQALRASLAFSRLDGTVPFTPARQTEAIAAMDELRTCVAGDPFTLRQLVTALGPAWNEYLALELSPAEKARFDEPALDAILGLIRGRRARMHLLEQAFSARTTAPWTALRYFSIEEEADDYAVRIGMTHGLTDLGVTATMFLVLGDLQPACEALLATGNVPYGLDLLDEHHAPCWRIDHARRLAASPSQLARGFSPEPRETTTPTRRETPKPLY
ncbi:MAG: M48 family metalloprotease [Myxococcales bacterium]|nr:M48 family metalloprotease [Myxococcales bacterium]